MDFKVRDRDAPITLEGIIFRVMGYTHLIDACFCDVEYAPNTIYQSSDPRSIRQSKTSTFHKFYADGGLKFISKNYPQYQVEYPPLKQKLIGLFANQITTLKRPKDALSQILHDQAQDNLIQATQDLVQLLLDHSKLRKSDFGIFGSMLHNFHNPKYSDIDLIVYGRKALRQLRETLNCLYNSQQSGLENEFPSYYNPQNWRFTEFTLDHLKTANAEKQIYGIYNSRILQRKVKVEFEPVRRWDEIKPNNIPEYRVTDIGWTRLEAIVDDSTDSGFMPSIYKITPLKFLAQPVEPPPETIISYVEEFRLQADSGDKVLVQGPLEQITTNDGIKNQIMLSYNSRYFEQVLRKL